MKKVAVYGSLREGMGNYFGFLKDSQKLSTETVEIPFEMIDLGGFPGLVESDKNEPVKIEVFEVDDRTYKGIERLEGYPSFYDKSVIKTSVGDAEVYFLHKGGRWGSHMVEKTEEGYDWVKHYMKKTRKL